MKILVRAGPLSSTWAPADCGPQGASVVFSRLFIVNRLRVYEFLDRDALMTNSCKDSTLKDFRSGLPSVSLRKSRNLILFGFGK
jgi:hypothetical protein